MKEKQYVSGREKEKGDRERQREGDKRIISFDLFPCIVSDSVVSLVLYQWEISLHCILTTDERHQREG